ncbi:MAG: ABC transporter permease subunit [Ilumatobacteraceae bacterium]
MASERVEATGIDRPPRGFRLVARYALLGAVTFVVLFPIYTMVIASLKPGNRVLVRPLVPDSFTLDAFRAAWTDGHLGRFLLNSAIVAVAVTLFQLASRRCCRPTPSRVLRGKRLVFAVFLATLLVPWVTLVVNRRTVDQLGWINTYQGLAAPFLATAFGTFLLRQVFLQLPKDLRGAARMDGLGHLGFLLEVAVPSLSPDHGTRWCCSRSCRAGTNTSAESRDHRDGHEHGAVRAPHAPRRHQPAQPRVGRHDHRRPADLRRAPRLPEAPDPWPDRRGPVEDDPMIAARRSPTARRARPIIVIGVAAAGLLAGCSGSGSLLTTPATTPRPRRSRRPRATTRDQGPAATRRPPTRRRPERRRPVRWRCPISPTCPTAALGAITDPVKVRFWHGMNGVNETAIGALVDGSTTPARTGSVVADNQGGYEAVIDKFLQSSDGVVPIWSDPRYGTQVMIDTGAIVPAQACIESSEYDTSSFLDIALRNYATAGVRWACRSTRRSGALRQHQDPRGLGLDPTMLSELRRGCATCEQIVASGSAPTCLSLDSGSDSGGGWFVEQWIANAGLAYADHDSGRTAPAERPVGRAGRRRARVSFLAGMIDDGLAVYVGDNSSGQEQFLRMVSRSARRHDDRDLGRAGAGHRRARRRHDPRPDRRRHRDQSAPGASPTPTAVPKRSGALHRGPDVMTPWSPGRGTSCASSRPRRPSRRGPRPQLHPRPLRRRRARSIASAYRDDPRYRVAFDQLVATADAPLAVAPLLGADGPGAGRARDGDGGDLQGRRRDGRADAAARADALIADCAARNGG